jgi:hypothetical protein
MSNRAEMAPEEEAIPESAEPADTFEMKPV